MKKMLLAIALAAGSSAAMADSVGVSVNIGEPGFYGQINIGNAPAPEVIYSQPVVIQQPVTVLPPPVYLRVPPGYEKHWSKHCAQYRACGRPVYFVRDSWYQNVYTPYYHGHPNEYHEDYHEDYHGEGHGHGHDHDPDDHGPPPGHGPHR